MEAPPKVLSIVWNLIRGGTEGQCARVALGHCRQGGSHRVAVFRREGFFLEEVEQTCGPVFDIGIQRMFTRDTFRRVKRLQRYIEQESFDLVHTWDADAAIFGSLAARWAKVPLITSRRDLGQIYPPYKRWLMHRADRQARAVVVNAHAIQSWAAGRGTAANKLHRIPNVLDRAEFDRQAAAALPSGLDLPSGKRIGMVSRLDPEKDVDTCLHAAARVVKTHPDVTFYIIGDGQERARLEALARELSLTGQVCFLGEIHTVPALVKKLDIGILLPRANEGLSNTILEYMAASLPVVATDCGGNAELVRDGKNGYVVPVGDADAAADAIIRLLNDPESARRMGRAGRERIETEFASESVLSQFTALYREVNDK